MKRAVILMVLAQIALATPLSQTNGLSNDLDKLYSSEIDSSKKLNEVSKSAVLNEYKINFLLSKRNQLIHNAFIIEGLIEQGNKNE